MSARTWQPALVTFAAVARGCALPAALALVLAAVAMRASRPEPGAGTAAAGPLLLWLHLPCVVLAAAAVVTALDAWPMFGREREGSVLLRRLTRSAIDGCGMAVAGGVAAAALLLAGTGAAFAAVTSLLDGVDAPRAFARADAAPGAATLDTTTSSIRLRAGGLVADAVRINPLALFLPGRPLAPVELSVTVDGETLTAPCRVHGNGEQVLLPLPAPRAVHDVVLAHTAPPALTLLFPPGSVELRGAAPRSLALNLALAAACYAAPVLLALLAACALRTVLGLPVLSTFALVSIAILALTGLTPESDALTACARARFVAAEPLAWRATAGAAALLLGLALLPWLAFHTRRGRA